MVENLKEPLLGRPAIDALDLVQKAEAVHLDDCKKLEKEAKALFPKLFKGLGDLKYEFTIKLKPNATPYAIRTPRWVALPLMTKVKEELQIMEARRRISICVDLTKLNECVLRETYPLPKIDNMLAQISDSKIFTKLDCNSGFWQEKLGLNSRLLTTFITPFGRFCFNRIPFGIKFAPEHCQKKMSQILDGSDGRISIRNVTVAAEQFEET